MPVSTIVMLAAVVAVFAIFAAALAWAQLQTRHLIGAPAPAAAITRPKRRAF
jgi:hypothetical protein